MTEDSATMELPVHNVDAQQITTQIVTRTGRGCACGLAAIRHGWPGSST